MLSYILQFVLSVLVSRSLGLLVVLLTVDSILVIRMLPDQHRLVIIVGATLMLTHLNNDSSPYMPTLGSTL